jgi:hypothetical protein
MLTNRATFRHVKLELLMFVLIAAWNVDVDPALLNRVVACVGRFTLSSIAAATLFEFAKRQLLVTTPVARLMDH